MEYYIIDFPWNKVFDSDIKIIRGEWFEKIIRERSDNHIYAHVHPFFNADLRICR